MRSAAMTLVALAACGLDVRGIGPASEADANGNASPNVHDGSVPLIDGGVSGASSSGAVADSSVPADGSSQPDAASPYEACPPSADLLLCLPFDGSVTDRSPSALAVNATNLGFVPGKRGEGGRFALSPKTDVRVAAYQGFNGATATIEFWINPASFPSSGQMVVVDQDSRFGVFLNADATVSCRTFPLTTKTVIGQWMHIACVNDGSKMYGYANGKLEASGANTLGTTSNFIGIGEDSPSTDRSLDAALDTLRIWKTARTAAEVAEAAR